MPFAVTVAAGDAVTEPMAMRRPDTVTVAAGLGCAAPWATRRPLTVTVAAGETVAAPSTKLDAAGAKKKSDHIALDAALSPYTSA
jgi:hypothetical protein